LHNRFHGFIAEPVVCGKGIFIELLAIGTGDGDFTPIKYKGLKNWQTLLDYLLVSKRVCVGAHALKGEMRCVCQFFIPSHLTSSASSSSRKGTGIEVAVSINFRSFARTPFADDCG
jgi:hypothetical protein